MKTIFKALIIATFLPGHFVKESSAMIDLNRYAKKIYKPVAAVNEAIISENDVQQTINIMRMSGVDMKRDEAIAKTINETVILCAGNKDITSSFVDSTISNLTAENGLSDDDFNKILEKFGVEMTYFRKQIEAQIILTEMVRDKVQGDQNPAIKALYKNTKIVQQQINKNDLILTRGAMKWQFNNDSQVKIAEILVSQKNQQNFDAIVSLLESNVEFTKIKKQFPNDVELTTGDGAIGWIHYNDLSETYKEVIKKSSIGYLTEPLAMEDKILFIQVIDIKNAVQSQSSDNKEYLNLSYDEKSAILLKNMQAKLYSEALINELKKQTFIQVF